MLGPAQLVGEHGAPPRTIDPLVLAGRYPASRLTEPGDVVSCTAPRPAARVDRDGGSVVAFPAKVLRCRDRRLVPAVVAADINAQPETAKAWRAWALRYAPEDQLSALARIIEDIDEHRQALHDRLDTLDELSASLITGATGGYLDLNPMKGTWFHVASQEGRSRRRGSRAALDHEGAQGHAVEGGGQAPRFDGRLAV